MEFARGDRIQAFANCETLYDMIPKLWMEIDQKIYTEINEALAAQVNAVQTSDISVKRTQRKSIIEKLKRAYSRPFFRVLMKTMDTHKYFDFGYSPLNETDFKKLEGDGEDEE